MSDERFWAKVDKGPHPKGCWLWTGYKQRFGHGAISRGGKTVLAHRHAWALLKGPLPASACLLHRCDVPACVSPDHLFIGDRATNMADMKAKGRRAYGEQTGCAKITEAQAKEILAAFRRYGPKRSNASELARRFGIPYQIVVNIGSGRSWNHVRRSFGDNDATR